MPFVKDCQASLMPQEPSVSAAAERSEVNVSAVLAGCHMPSARASGIMPHYEILAVLLLQIRLGAYLMVDKDVLWVTPEIFEQLNIMSNLEWTIN